MQYLILHAGMPKTGSTAFQYLLGKYADELSKFSIHIANSPNREPYIRQYTEISEYLLRINLDTHLRQWSPQVILPSVRNEFYLDIKSNLSSNCEKVIMSSEDLFFIRKEEELQKLADLTKRTIHVVMTLRSPESFLTSYRNQIYKNHMLPSLHKDSINYIDSDSWIVDYESIKNLYKKFSKKIFIKFIDYEAITFKKKSILKDLWDLCLLPSNVAKNEDFLTFNNTANDADRFHLDLVKTNVNGFNICHSVDHSYYAIHGKAGAVTDNKSLEDGIKSGFIIKKSSYRGLLAFLENNKDIVL